MLLLIILTTAPFASSGSNQQWDEEGLEDLPAFTPAPNPRHHRRSNRPSKPKYGQSGSPAPNPVPMHEIGLTLNPDLYPTPKLRIPDSPAIVPLRMGTPAGGGLVRDSSEMGDKERPHVSHAEADGMEGRNRRISSAHPCMKKEFRHRKLHRYQYPQPSPIARHVAAQPPLCPYTCVPVAMLGVRPPPCSWSLQRCRP